MLSAGLMTLQNFSLAILDLVSDLPSRRVDWKYDIVAKVKQAGSNERPKSEDRWAASFIHR